MSEPTIFCFFPLASVGGTELVHLDVLKALGAAHKEIFIRYKVTPWKGIAFKQSIEGKKEGIQLKSEFEAFGRLTFLSNYLEAKRFGRLIRAWYIRRLLKKINACPNPIVIFWHRESIEFLWDQLAPHVKIIDIVHNNSNNHSPDASFLLNDWAPRINHRVLVNAGLMRWIKPLYQEQRYPLELVQRISVISHQVTIPMELTTKPEEVFHVLYVGREAKEKRIALFFEIAERFSQDPRIRFRAVGIDQPINAPQNVQCLGVITNRETLEQCYASSHVLVLTSESEGFPKVISEAMAFGCVPLVTAVGAIPEVLNHGVQAILTDPLNCVNETVNFLSRLLVDRTEYETLSKKAYLYAKEEFDANRFNNEWRTLIQTLG
jgi:glycosyltransferase involved in cell wall biosynthesis